MKNQQNSDFNNELYLELYTKHYKTLVRMFLKTNRSMDDALDAASDFLLKMAEKLSSENAGSTKFSDAYIKGSFKNFVFDCFRRKKPYSISQLNSERSDSDFLSGNAKFDIAGFDAADSKTISRMNKDVIAACYSKMKPEDINFVQMRFENNMPNREIAELLGQSVDYVANKVSRAKVVFKNAFQKLGYNWKDF